MAISKLFRLNKVNDKNKSSKNVKKFDKGAKSKPNKKVVPLKHTPGPSCIDNLKVSLDSSQLTKVIEAFKKREADSNSNEKDLLDESSRKYVLLQFRLSKLPPEPHVKPLQIQLKHPIYSGKEICVLVKDPQKTWKTVIFDLKIPEIKKVMGVGKLRKKYKTYEDKRALCNSFDLFLCDKSVLPSVPSILGSYFIEKKKLPVGVNLSKNKIKNSFLTAINSTYYKLSQGSFTSVRVATYSMPTDQIVDNVMKVLDSVKKFHTEHEVFKNHICSVFLNWGGSDSLPLYSEELLEVEKINDAAK
uniref:Ribosomal protein L1p/L10e family, putative n=1 Tax=Theileria annulata TaxID=5874 RepID=A0A3B0MKV7_THEAN